MLETRRAEAKTYVQEQCILCHGFHEGVDLVITLPQRVVNGDDKWLHREMGLSEMGDPLAKTKKVGELRADVNNYIYSLLPSLANAPRVFDCPQM